VILKQLKMPLKIILMCSFMHSQKKKVQKLSLGLYLFKST